ncbi:MAG: hypothetical protein NVSMB17_08390 [Candidatus Dormibacteria bacterium]
MVPWVSALAGRGEVPETVPLVGKLPMRVEKALEVYRAQLAGRANAVIGGVSYGGRVASMLAAGQEVAGLVLLSYPLHPPGKIDQQRTAHLPAIRCPVLFLSGEADPFARLELLREVVAALPSARLVSYPRVGHGLTRHPAVFDDAVLRIAAFTRDLG